MKKTMLTFALAAALPALAMTETAPGVTTGVPVSDFKLERNGNYLSLDMALDLTDLDIRTNEAVLLTPRLVNGTDTLTLRSVALYGRRRYYYYKRNFAGTMLSGDGETTIRATERPATVDYHEVLPFEAWMDGATLQLDRADYGCCRTVLATESDALGSYHAPLPQFFPELVYVQPTGSREKRRSLEGQSFIDFPVNQTVINPEYRRNAVELAKIRATIDTVRNDRDATIDTVWLKGYASPESPYSHNAELAIGRTEALKRYIQQMYDFRGVALLTDHEPEDWAGLRRAVESSNLTHRAEILALIDRTDLEPDPKEWKIKSTYPDEYRFMLQNFYPALRHTDYRVSYVIREYSDPLEILAIMRTQPQKLGLNEFYVAASELEPGTEEFTEVFETAVRLFPEDEAANLNAANAAMRRGDNERAARYLEKAGTSAEAVYARGALAIRTEDYASARRYLTAARAAGLAQAGETLAELESRYAE